MSIKATRSLANSAHTDSFGSLAIAKDMAERVQHHKWKWALIMAMVNAIVKSLWAIYFINMEGLGDDDDERAA